jgi:hypothetical protein
MVCSNVLALTLRDLFHLVSPVVREFVEELRGKVKAMVDGIAPLRDEIVQQGMLNNAKAFVEAINSDERFAHYRDFMLKHRALLADANFDVSQTFLK